MRQLFNSANGPQWVAKSAICLTINILNPIAVPHFNSIRFYWILFCHYHRAKDCPDVCLLFAFVFISVFLNSSKTFVNPLKNISKPLKKNRNFFGAHLRSNQCFYNQFRTKEFVTKKTVVPVEYNSVQNTTYQNLEDLALIHGQRHREKLVLLL